MRVVNGILRVALVWSAFSAVSAGVLLQPYEAPEWNVTEWINGDPGPLRSQRGRVVVIQFFQLWCPGCGEFSIPLMNEWTEKWSERDDVMVVSIHTVFEGHDVQTPERLRSFVRETRMRHPVGIDKYSSPGDEAPITMNRFNTGGTPHVAVVDKEGKLRFSHFGRFDPATIEAFVERLAKERGSAVQPGPRTTSPGAGRDRPPATAAVDKATAQRPTRPGPGARPTRPADPEDSPDPDAGAGAGADPRLSGSYQMQFQQQSKSCGATARPENVPVGITVSNDRIVARFRTRFLGLNQFSADYDPATGRFSDETMRRSDENGVGVTLNMRLSGSVDLNADPPTLQFQFELDKEGDEPGWECKVTGAGSATRTPSAGSPSE